MPQTITALFENGVFVPTSKVVLPEHTKVTISLPTAPGQPVKPCPLDAIVNIAAECKDLDLSVNHDKYLYGDDPL